VFTTLLLLFENLARNGSRGFTRGGLDGWGFRFHGILRASSVIGKIKFRNSEITALDMTRRLLVKPSHSDAFCLWIFVQLLPARTTIAAARRADIAPNAAIVVPLVQVAARGDDFVGMGIVVEPLPAGAARSLAWCAGIAGYRLL